MSKLKLKCLSNEKEEIFSFEINMKLNNLSFFTGNENVKLFVKKREKATNEYIIGCNPRHYQNLLNVFDYINLIETIPPHHSNLIMILNILKQNLRIILQESKKLFKNDKSIFFKIWEINRAATKIYISFIKSLVTLKIPSLNKLEYLEPFEQFMVKKDALFELMKDLKEMIFAELANNYQYNIKDEYYVIHNFYENLILFNNDFEKNYGNTINEKYNQFFNNLSSVTEFSEKIKDKINKNTQFSFDSIDKKVENFIDKHYYPFLEYCDIMGSCNEVYLDEYLYNKSLIISGSYRKVLEEMFFDIVVAKEMKKYLEIYKSDKTDFLTFARTYYFKNKLFDKILDNLNTLNSSLLFNERADNIYEKTVVLSQEDQNLISRIENLQKKLVPIFNLWPKTKSRSISEDNENTSINMHQNLSENKTQISNENQMNDEKNLDRSEENETDQNGDISILKDSNESDGENFCDQSKQDESQGASNEQKEDETTLLYVTEIDNDKNIEKASLKEKSQESEDFNKEKYEQKNIKSKNLFINDEISAEKNHKYNLDHSKSFRNKINDEQDKKTESGLIIKQNINDESKLKNETKFNEYTSQIYCNEKQTINTHNNEKSNTEGHYIFHIVLVMFAAVSLIGLFVFCVNYER